MALPKVVFHRDASVSINKIFVGTVLGEAHCWHFKPYSTGRHEGPFRNRAPIKKRARELYAVIEKQRVQAFIDGR